MPIIFLRFFSYLKSTIKLVADPIEYSISFLNNNFLRLQELIYKHF